MQPTCCKNGIVFGFFFFVLASPPLLGRLNGPVRGGRGSAGAQLGCRRSVVGGLRVKLEHEHHEDGQAQGPRSKATSKVSRDKTFSTLPSHPPAARAAIACLLVRLRGGRARRSAVAGLVDQKWKYRTPKVDPSRRTADKLTRWIGPRQNEGSVLPMNTVGTVRVLTRTPMFIWIVIHTMYVLYLVATLGTAYHVVSYSESQGRRGELGELGRHVCPYYLQRVVEECNKQP